MVTKCQNGRNFLWGGFLGRDRIKGQTSADNNAEDVHTIFNSSEEEKEFSPTISRQDSEFTEDMKKDEKNGTVALVKYQYRRKYKPMYSMYGRTEADARLVDHEISIGMNSFVEYLNSMYMSKNRTYTTMAPKATWSWHWPPYLLIARGAVMVISVMLRFMFLFSDILLPHARNTAHFFFNKMEEVLLQGFSILKLPTILLLTLLITVSYVTFGIISFFRMSMKWVLMPVKKRPTYSNRSPVVSK